MTEENVYNFSKKKMFGGKWKLIFSVEENGI